MRTPGAPMPEPVPPSRRRAFVRPARRVAAGLGTAVLLVALLATLSGGCTVRTRVEHPRLPALLPPVVDSLVIPPFERAAGVELAPVELELFARHLGEALQRREHLRVYPAPPTRLPNTVRLAGRLEALAVNERNGDGLQLRTVDLTVAVQVLPVEGEAPLLTVRRRTARQKVYLGEPMSALALDLEDAVREVTAQLAQALAPLPDAPAIALRVGDPGQPLRALKAGNAAAAAGDFAQARLHWLAVLFDPAPGDRGGAYRITPAVLNHLRRTDVPEDTVQRLAALNGRGAEPLAGFRRTLRTALGGDSPQEGRILTLADTRFSVAHANLAAAHANLGALAALERRGDLAAYHWARAWGHDPAPPLLEAWRALQDERKTLPRGIPAEDALRAYLRLPAPATAAVRPGSFERTVLPPPAFEAVADSAPAGQDGTAGGSAPPAPVPAPPAPAAAAGTTGRAAGSGPAEAPPGPDAGASGAGASAPANR